jgi:Ca2+-binding EF-hand superfamily protein
MWEKKLIRKIKEIITSSSLTIDKFFSIMDKDGNGTIEANELRKGLESYNIYMNHNDWCNLFNLLDSDKSGEIDLNELKALLEQEKTGKLENVSGIKIIGEGGKTKSNEEEHPE